MAPIYLVTGAAGHLGGTLIRLLRRRGAQVRGLLVFPLRPLLFRKG